MKALSLQEIEFYRNEALKRKAVLEGLKEKGGKDWNDDLQDELNDIVLLLVDMDEAHNEVAAKAEPVKAGYAVSASEAHLVHVKIVHGRRFNSRTGKEESFPYIQKFTRAEWALFEKNAVNLGYDIIEILHKP